MTCPGFTISTEQEPPCKNAAGISRAPSIEWWNNLLQPMKEDKRKKRRNEWKEKERKDKKLPKLQKSCDSKILNMRKCKSRSPKKLRKRQIPRPNCHIKKSCFVKVKKSSKTGQSRVTL